MDWHSKINLTFIYFFLHYDNDFSQLWGLVIFFTTALGERTFSAMNIIKGPLYNKMGD